MAHLPESQAQFEYTKMQLIGSLGAVAETMRNAATFAEQFAQMLGPLTYAGAPLMFPNGQIPQMPPPQAEPTGGKRKARGEEEGEGKRKRKTKPKDPLAPKRPASSYLLFQNEVRQELKAKHPNIPNNELLAKIAKAWSEMPKEQKDRYEERHTASKNLYLERKRLYERSLPGAPASATEGVNPAVIAPAVVATPAAASSDQEDDENEGGDDGAKESSEAESSEEDEEEAPPPKKNKPDSKTDQKEKKRKSKA